VYYHGSQRAAWGRYVIQALTHGGTRLTIARADGQHFVLCRARLVNVTPAGQVVVLCSGCGHTAECLWEGQPGICGVLGCLCNIHRAGLTASAAAALLP
jgi:hypothetical protein